MVIMKRTKGAFRDKGGFGVNGPAPMRSKCSDSKCCFKRDDMRQFCRRTCRGEKEEEEQREGGRQAGVGFVSMESRTR